MADSSERVGVELYLDLTTYNRQVADAIAGAGEVEAAWKAALGSIGGDLSFKVNVDMGDLSTVSRSLADLATEDANIRILADDGELVSAQRKIEDIDSSAPTVPVDADDTELDTAKRKVDDLDSETASVKVDADTSGADSALDDIKQQLEDLKGLAVIDLVMQASGPALGLLQQALELVTSTDEAVRLLGARTGEVIPNASEIIDRLYTANWGESKQQIAEVLALSSQLGIEQDNLASATETAFQVASVTGGEVTEILRAQSSLVKNGLAPNYQAAADLITAGFQTGADRGDDLLDTFNEYGSTFRQLGLDGAQALEIINSGLAAGFDNSDRVADILRELGIRITDLDDTAAQSALDTLGLPSPAEGEALGADFLNQILTGIQNAAPEDQTILTRSLFGTLSEDFGLQTILGLGTDDAITATFDTIDGRAQESADLINDTLGGALNTLFRNVEVEAQKFLSSDQINLDQKIDDIKNGITSTLQALGEGEDLAGALEIGLAIPGFADSIARFEASIGSFAISILELIAGVQDFLGKDSSGTRGQIRGLAEGQLAVDLKVANEDEIAGAIQRASERGVSAAGINEAIQTAVGELVDEGDVERAQQVADSIKEAADYARENFDPGAAFRRGRADEPLLAVDTAALDEQLAAANLWSDAFAQIQASADNDSYINNMLGNARASQTFVEAANEVSTVSASMLEFGNIGEQLGLDETVVSAQESLWSRVNSAVQQTMSTDVPQAVDAGATAVEEADNRIAMAMTGNTMTASFETVQQVAASTMAGMTESVSVAMKIATAAEVMFTNQTNILTGALLGLIGQAGPGILALAQNLQNVANGASIAAQTFSAATSAAAAAGAGGGLSEFAGGGVMSGISVVGEKGPEIVTSDVGAAVLNNRSTNAVFNAIRSAAFSLAGGGAGAVASGGNRNTFNFYTQSDAQAVLVSREVGRILRGQ